MQDEFGYYMNLVGGEYVNTDIRHPVRGHLFEESDDLEDRLEELYRLEAEA